MYSPDIRSQKPNTLQRWVAFLPPPHPSEEASDNSAQGSLSKEQKRSQTSNVFGNIATYQLGSFHSRWQGDTDCPRQGDPASRWHVGFVASAVYCPSIETLPGLPLSGAPGLSGDTTALVGDAP